MSTPHTASQPAEPALAPAAPPLYVDLDGSLSHTDLLFESFLLLIKRNPLYAFWCVLWLFGGGIGRLKAEIARRVDLDVTVLPYNDALLAHLRAQREAGRRIVLASAANRELVARIAEHLDVFDGWLASDERTNLKAGAKLRAIEADAQGPFAYAANGHVDLVVWERAAEIIVVNPDRGVLAAASKIRQPSLVLPKRPAGLRVWLKAVRLHQWAKNALLFVPLLAAHSLDPTRWLSVLLAFVAFGLCASATYVINDLLDLASDRQHPRKRFRPFASAVLSIPSGMTLAAVFLPLSFVLAWIVSSLFLAMVLVYLVLTLAYSLGLKRVTFVDVLLLAFLYTYRVLAGGLAAGVVVSNWLLAVSMFMFLSLALVKRCAELEVMNESGKAKLAGRGYRSTDLPYLISMGIASGFAAVMVLALYIDAQEAGAMYPRAQLLWLILPVLLYWIMRLWMKTSRMEIHDDPLQFAISDPASWLAGAIIGCIALAASFGSYS